MNNHIPFRALQVLECCVRTGSYSLASEELRISVSAVSQQIKLLESYFSESLFVKQGNKIIATQTALEIQQRLAPALFDIKGVCQSLRKGEQQTIRLFSYPSFSCRWLVDELAEFNKLNPHIDLQIGFFHQDRELTDMVADLFVTNVFGQPGYHYLEMFPEENLLICSPRYLAKHGPITLDNLSSHTLLVANDKEYGMDWDPWFRQQGVTIEQFSNVRYFNHSLLCQHAAEADQGIALAFRHTMSKLVDKQRLVALDLPSNLSGLHYYLAYKADRRRDPNLQTVTRFLLERAQTDKQRALPTSAATESFVTEK